MEEGFDFKSKCHEQQVCFPLMTSQNVCCETALGHLIGHMTTHLLHISNQPRYICALRAAFTLFARLSLLPLLFRSLSTSTCLPVWPYGVVCFLWKFCAYALFHTRRPTVPSLLHLNPLSQASILNLHTFTELVV